MRIAVAPLVFLASCGFANAPVVPVNGPNGQFGYLQVSCPHDQQRCRDLASKSCPKGYEVVDRRGDGSRYTSPSGMDDADGAPGENGTLLVACK